MVAPGGDLCLLSRKSRGFPSEKDPLSCYLPLKKVGMINFRFNFMGMAIDALQKFIFEYFLTLYVKR
jgi:hypothetical protein